ncbi:MAG: hypothetical protein ABIP20_12020 [Chthoniobacteraceae bacterium]
MQQLFHVVAITGEWHVLLKGTFISMKSPLGKRAKTAIFAAL